MARLTIIQFPANPPAAVPSASASITHILRQRAAKVLKVDRNVRWLLDDLAETLEFTGALGLAAPQVGAPQRIFVLRNGAEILKFINPTIIRFDGRQDSQEACLSLPGVFGIVVRPARVVVHALDENGKPTDFEAIGRLASALSHECDHLDGVLFTDKAYAVRRMSAPPRQPEPPQSP